MNIILASNSPRRKELLEKEGITFTVIPSNCAEPENPGLSPEKYAEFLSKLKAENVLSSNDGVVIGADTIVVMGDKILGKPTDFEDATSMLELLSGKTHKVITGYTVISKNKIVTDNEVTFVTFNNLSFEQILNYLNEMKPFDKAGAYGIQDGFDLVEKIEGDYDNVVGLPTKKILNVLREFL